MDEEILYFGPDDFEILDVEDYVAKPTSVFSKLPEIARPLLSNANAIFLHIEKLLYTAPSFIYLLTETMPEEMLQAVLSEDQKQAIAKGVLKLMTKKDGSLMATLLNTDTGKIVAAVPLETVKLAPEITEKSTHLRYPSFKWHESQSRLKVFSSLLRMSEKDKSLIGWP